MQSQRLVPYISTNCFFKYRLHLMIRHLNLTTSARLIRGSYFMNHVILFKQSLKRSVIKLTNSINNKSSRDPVSMENVLFHKLDHNHVVIGPSSQSFHRLWHIINSNHYKTKPKARGKGPMKSMLYTSHMSTIKIVEMGIISRQERALVRWQC